MRKDIIKTDNYLIIVSDDEIKVGDWVCYMHETDGRYKQITQVKPNNTYFGIKKIIAHRAIHLSPKDPVYENLPGLPLLPQLPIEDNVVELAEKYVNSVVRTKHSDWDIEKGYVKGYDKAKEKYKYTEEDMKKCWEACMRYDRDKSEGYAPNYIEFIQSLSQPKLPIAFECEMELYDVGGYSPEREIKKTTNNGDTIFVGTYIF